LTRAELITKPLWMPRARVAVVEKCGFGAHALEQGRGFCNYLKNNPHQERQASKSNDALGRTSVLDALKIPQTNPGLNMACTSHLKMPYSQPGSLTFSKSLSRSKNNNPRQSRRLAIHLRK